MHKQVVKQTFKNNSMEGALAALGKSIARWTEKGDQPMTAIPGLSLSRRDELTHKVMLADVVQRHGVDHSGLMVRLKRHPELLDGLTNHQRVTATVRGLRLPVEAITLISWLVARMSCSGTEDAV